MLLVLKRAEGFLKAFNLSLSGALATLAKREFDQICCVRMLYLVLSTVCFHSAHLNQTLIKHDMHRYTVITMIHSYT